MAKPNPSVQKRIRERKKMERRQEKERRKAARKAAKEAGETSPDGLSEGDDAPAGDPDEGAPGDDPTSSQ